MRIIKKGATSQTIYVEVLDSSSTTGGRLTGLAYNTASLVAYYVRNGGSSTSITLATLAAANSAYSSGGFKEVDATNMPGVYRLDLPDAAVASGADSVVVTLKGATNMVQVSEEIQLVAVDHQDATKFGMTRVVANVDQIDGAAWSTHASGMAPADLRDIAGAAVSASTAQLGVNVVNFGGSAGTFASGRPEVNTTHWKGTAAAVVDTAGYPVVTVKDGTGQGEIALTSGVIDHVTLVDTATTLTNAPSDSSGVTTLLSRLSATRAGYLDNLSAGAVALESSVQSVLSKLLKYVQLIVRKDAAIATDNATELTAINANGGSGAGSFDNTTDSEQALRDRGDAAWITATGFSTLDAAGVRTAVGLASANLDTQLSTISGYIDTEVAAIKAKTDNLPASPASSADVTALLTTQITESYNADGSAPTVSQALMGILQRLTEFAISGTTITVKKLDGTTTAMTLTIDDATNPTSSTRSA